MVQNNHSTTKPHKRKWLETYNDNDNQTCTNYWFLFRQTKIQSALLPPHFGKILLHTHLRWGFLHDEKYELILKKSIFICLISTFKTVHKKKSVKIFKLFVEGTLASSRHDLSNNKLQLDYCKIYRSPNITALYQYFCYLLVSSSK